MPPFPVFSYHLAIKVGIERGFSYKQERQPRWDAPTGWMRWCIVGAIPLWLPFLVKYQKSYASVLIF